MTKLEEKLIELGYEKGWYEELYVKLSYGWEFSFIVNYTKTKVLHYYVKTETEIDVCLCCQKDVDYYQNILNQLQADLEVLKEYE